MKENLYLKQIYYLIEKYYAHGKINDNELNQINQFTKKLEHYSNDLKSGGQKSFDFEDFIIEDDAVRFKKNFENLNLKLSYNKIKFDYTKFDEDVNEGLKRGNEFLKIYFLQRINKLFLGLSISKHPDFIPIDEDILIEITNEEYSTITKANFTTAIQNFEEGYYKSINLATANQDFKKNTTMVRYKLKSVSDYNKKQYEEFKMDTLSLSFIQFDNKNPDTKYKGLNKRISVCVSPEVIASTTGKNNIPNHDFGTIYP